MNRRDVLIGAALAVVPAMAPPALSAPTRTLVFQSSGRPVTMDIGEPARPGPRPAVLLLHGRAGLSFYGAALRSLADGLAAAGMVALTPHYFDASGSADSPEVTRALFETWRSALSDALAFAAMQPGVDSGRIAVVGVSLGGFIAGVEAAQNERIAALVSESSGVSTWFPASPRRMPPLLIVHSRDDETVPLSNALRLAQIARGLGVEPEIALYSGRDHVLTGATAREADAKIVAFLADRLRA
ncbi:MAG: alpha/beta hydrolase family protein [Acidobacteriota bacterium]